METRLGDIIDDFCVKCKRIMNHAVVSILDSKPAKVRCRTCYNDHDYRHEQAPPPKVDPRKLALLAEKAAQAAAVAPPPTDLEVGEVVEAAVSEEVVVPKVKAKARGRK
jgi:hypothetical protein